jgi:WD40 repeat protein
VKLEFSPSSKLMLGVVGLTLVVFICSGFSDCDPCKEITKEDKFGGIWVACVDNKPVLMKFDDNLVVSLGSANFNSADYVCTSAGSPRYKGSSATAPDAIGTPSGPLGSPSLGSAAAGQMREGRSEKPRAASGSVAYLPPFLRDLPFVPSLPASPGACDSSFPDVFQTIHPQSKVTRISTCPFRVVTTIPVDSRPLQVAITPDGSTALVTSFDNAVNFIDLSTNKVVFTLRTDQNVNPHGLAITPDGKRAYITSFNPFNPVVQVIDLTTRTVTETFRTNMQYPQGATLTPDGAQLWITGPLDGVVEVYDTLSSTLAARVNAGVTTDVAFNSTGTRAFITSQVSQPGTVVVVDTATFLVVKTYTVGRGATDISMSYGDQFLVVNNDLDGSISVIDLISNKVSTTKLGSAVSGISFVK